MERVVWSRIFFLVNNPWKFFKTNVCFSFLLFGYFEIAGQNDPKRRFDDYFFVSCITQHFSLNWFLVCRFFCLIFLFCFLTLIQQIYCQGFTEGNKSGLWSMCIWFPFGSELYECLDEFMEDKLSSSTDTFISTPPEAAADVPAGPL